jgi:outer membrane receptor protein involved in Fe transport
MKSLFYFSKLTLLSFCLLSSTIIFSQRPQSFQKLTVTGTIVDQETQQPLEYATITFRNELRPEMLQGGITTENGKFSIEVFPGKYNISSEYISFKTITQEGVMVRSNTDLGTINLEIEASSLDEVELVGELTTVEIRLDKRIYNVGKDITVRGGSVSDVLDNVPSVSVDVEGVVSLRGNDNVRILINGKPSGLVGLSGPEGLRQIPAESIEKVEVVTSPSARYDAAGTAGILNIILKKNTLDGFNGSIVANTGVPKNFRGSASLNWRTEKVNIFTTTTVGDSESEGGGVFNSEYLGAQAGNFSNERRDYTRNRKNFFTNIGLEYIFDEQTSLTVSGFYQKSDRNSLSSTNIESITPISTLYTERIEDEVELDETKQFTLNYTKKFDNKGHELVAEFQYESSVEDEDSDIITAIPEEVFTAESQTRILYQADYVWPIDENTQFELGYRGNFKTQETDYNVAIQDNNVFVPNTDLSNFLAYTENVNAAYTQFGKKIDKFSYLFGLRMEHSNIIIDQRTTNTKVKKNYADWFPTINLSYEMNEKENVTLGFSRRIRRPRGWSLNPFPSRSSVTFFRQGNPDLDPSYSSTFDLGYLKRWEKLTFNGSVYYQKSTQNIERITEETGELVEVTTAQGSTTLVPALRSISVNLSENNRVGTEFTLTYTPSRKVRLSGNFNIFNSQTIGDYFGKSFDAEIISWFSRINASVKLPGGFDTQLRGFYFGPRANAQTESKGVFTLSGAVNKSILNKKGTLSLRASDLLNSSRRKSTTTSENFTSYSEFQWRQPSYVLTFTYKINESKAAKRRRASRNSQGDGGGDGENFDF